MWANVILILHVLYVSFVIGAWLLIWIGGPAKWQWIRNRKFRLIHLGCIGLVVAESLLGITCPLTFLENTLREQPYEMDFVAFWLHELIFYSAPSYVFTIAYTAFLLTVLAAWVWFPPHRRSPKDR